MAESPDSQNDLSFAKLHAGSRTTLVLESAFENCEYYSSEFLQNSVIMATRSEVLRKLLILNVAG